MTMRIAGTAGWDSQTQLIDRWAIDLKKDVWMCSSLGSALAKLFHSLNTQLKCGKIETNVMILLLQSQQENFFDPDSYSPVYFQLN